ncbi:ABC-type sulfate/molybdate transport systems ATPase subunit/ABC-type sulfate transport system permease component [Catenulispora sp. MAP12-49]|uniref:ABC transporter ATP-binding protein/permease n=1 Tax=Catenulispora sp. MAP12-49 TaxID=3156302 RepID=UPI0035179EE1
MLRTPLPWLAALLVAYLLVPLVAFLVRVPGQGAAATSAPGVGDALRTSLITASISTAVVTFLGVPLGYLLARSTSRTAGVLGVAVQLPLALPPLMSGILLIYLVGPYTAIGQFFNGGLTDSATGVVLAQCFVAAPFLVVSARSAFAAVDPAQLDVAATLGHGALSQTLRVALPIAARGIRAGMLLAWLRAFGEFGATIVLAYHPYTLPVFTYVQFSSTGLAATTIPVLVTLGAALVVLLIADRGPARRAHRRRPVRLPEPRPPALSQGPVLDFDVTARLGGFRLAVAHRGAGRNLAILGASGSGKSATLRLLAGVLPAHDAHNCISLGGRDLAALPAERRGIGYLPQHPTLLPHLRVWEQVTFGVGADPALAAFWLDRLKLTELADRYPDQLSGGQARRVGLARALAREPRLLLLDEPFAGLDAPVRDELRRLLRTVLRETALTSVLVTHDPDDAALLSQDTLLFADGAVLQDGSTRAVLAQPAGPAAARLLGVRNIARGHVDADGILESGPYRIPLPASALATPAWQNAAPPPADVAWCVQPHDVRLVAAGGVAAIVDDVAHLGPIAELILRLEDGGEELTVTVPAGQVPEPGARCRVDVPSHAVIVWPAP